MFNLIESDYEKQYQCYDSIQIILNSVPLYVCIKV
jgi:hypothetical protein